MAGDTQRPLAGEAQQESLDAPPEDAFLHHPNCQSLLKTCIAAPALVGVRADGILDRSQDSHLRCIGHFHGPSNLYDAPS